MDTLIMQLNLSLKNASGEDEKTKIRQQFSLMIQNYVFFLDARLQFESDVNNQEFEQILDDAGQLLGKSVTELTTIAIPGKAFRAGLLLRQIVIKNVMKPEGQSFLKSIFKWWRKEEDLKEKQGILYEIIFNTTLKLAKYKNLVGPSIPISGMIERYTPQIANFYFGAEDNKKIVRRLERAIKDFNVVSNNSLPAIMIFGAGMFFMLIRRITLGIGYGVANLFSTAEEAHEIDADTTSLYFRIIVIMAVAVQLYNMYKNKKRLSEMNAALSELKNSDTDRNDSKSEFIRGMYKISGWYSNGV